MKNKVIIVLLLIGSSQVSAQFRFSTLLNKSTVSTQPMNFQKSLISTFGNENYSSQSQSNTKPSIWVEIGYILAMETFFAGMGYKGSRENRWGPIVVGGIDLVFVVAGLGNASAQELYSQKVGYYLLTAGFLTKALYNFKFNEIHNPKERFWSNFVGFNVLIFTGYYLDSLN